MQTPSREWKNDSESAGPSDRGVRDVTFTLQEKEDKNETGWRQSHVSQ